MQCVEGSIGRNRVKEDPNKFHATVTDNNFAFELINELANAVKPIVLPGEEMTIESITDSVFVGSLVEEIDYGPFKAVIPQVQGTAHITGMHTFVLDPKDPMKNGFILR